MNAPFILIIGAVALITASPSLLFLVLLIAGIDTLVIKSANKQASIQKPIPQPDTDSKKNKPLPLDSQQKIVEKPIATKANKEEVVKPKKKPKPRIDKSESASAKSDEPSAKDSSLVYKRKRSNTSKEFNFNSVSDKGSAKKNLKNSFNANRLGVSRNNYLGDEVSVSDIILTLTENQYQESNSNKKSESKRFEAGYSNKGRGLASKFEKFKTLDETKKVNQIQLNDSQEIQDIESESIDTRLGGKDFRACYGRGGLGASSSYPHNFEKCNNNRRMIKVNSVKQGYSQEIQDMKSESTLHHH